MTFYTKVHVGSYGQANSSIEVWVAREGATSWSKIVNITDFTFNVNDPSTWGFNNTFLGPYMTSLSPTSGKPGVTSYMWFDELIVSTQPIALPGGGASAPPTSPLAPSGLVIR
jgi:hypothetical protein